MSLPYDVSQLAEFVDGLGLGAATLLVAIAGLYYRKASSMEGIAEREQRLQRLYEGKFVNEKYAQVEIAQIRCTGPKTLFGKLKRKLLRQVGRTTVTILVKPPVKGDVWDPMDVVFEDNNAQVLKTEVLPSGDRSTVVVELHSLNPDDVEEVIGYIPVLLSRGLESGHLNMAPYIP